MERKLNQLLDWVSTLAPYRDTWRKRWEIETAPAGGN